jgi:hypothetical protein
MVLVCALANFTPTLDNHLARNSCFPCLSDRERKNSTAARIATFSWVVFKSWLEERMKTIVETGGTLVSRLQPGVA